MSSATPPPGPWTGAGPPPPRPNVKVLSVGPSAPVIVRFLSPRPACFETHWAEGREHICTLPMGKCWFCESGGAARWTAMLLAQTRGAGPAVAVRISAGAAAYCGTDHFTDGGPSLRGWWGQLSRMTPKKNGPLRLELKPPGAGLVFIPPSPDVFEFVMRLYRLTVRPSDHLPPADAGAVV